MGTKSSRAIISSQIVEEASEWLINFRVGDVDARALKDFDIWLRRSPEHIQAYLQIAEVWMDLPSVMAKLDIQELIAGARSEANNVVSLNPFAETSKYRPKAPRRVLLAASIVLTCAGATFFAWFTAHRIPTYATKIGEQRSIVLADGSRIDLNARSHIRIRFTETERNVDLLQGQALFTVARNKSRPFDVQIGGTRVRAVGTQFDVYRKESGTTVTVLEGRVAVLSEGHVVQHLPASPSPERSQSQRPLAQLTMLVSAGEQVIVAPGAISQPKPADVSAATAWTQRRLVFNSTGLAQVAEEFNRYNARQLVIQDAQLEELRISGVYSSTDPASLLRFLRAQPGISVTETSAEVRIARQ